MNRVVVHTRDVVAARMAGPGMRAFHFATELGKRFEVCLIADLQDDFARGGNFDALSRSDPTVSSVLRNAAVVIGQPTRELLRLSSGPRRVFDLFDPLVLELPEVYAGSTGLRGRAHQWIEWRRLGSALEHGDLLVCATRQQFAFYSGVHLRSGAMADGWLDRWVTVPFGVEVSNPADDGPPIDLGGDVIAIWGGGMWPWLDPESAVAAVRRVRDRGVAMKLLFLGTRRPNDEVDQAAGGWGPDRDESILNNPDWVPYRERSRWLRASRVAVMLHKESLEAEFAIRTRLFDAIWCGVPVVVSSGGFAADLVEREGLGIVVGPSDVDAVADALERLAGDDGFHASCVRNLERIRLQFSWSEVVRPLADRIELLF